MSTHLQKITAKAKSLRRSHPNMKWTSLIKLAAKKVKPAAKKRATPKKKKRSVGAYKVIQKGEKRSAPSKRVYRQVRSKSGEFKGMQTVSGIIRQAKTMLVSDLGKLEAKKYMASTKRDKAKIQKNITAKKAQLRRLKC